MQDFKPVLLTDKSRLQEIYNLRVEAYQHSPKSKYINKETYPNGWFDDLDDRDETIHWIIEDKGKIVAAARLAILNDIQESNEAFDKFELPKERPFAYWSRLVVHPVCRGKSISTLLDNNRKAWLLSNPAVRFAIRVGTCDRHSAFLRLGFEKLGDVMSFYGKSTIIVSAFVYLQKSPY